MKKIQFSHKKVIFITILITIMIVAIAVGIADPGCTPPPPPGATG